MFSERYGYKPEKIIQYETISDTLRRRIWNLFYQNDIIAGGLSSKRIAQSFKGEPTIDGKIADKLGFLVGTLDKGVTVEKILNNYVLVSAEWYKVYDFIETHLSTLSEDEFEERCKQYNQLLEEEKSGYRVINGEIAPITNPSEIECIEQAIASAYDSVSQHIQKALSLYADIQSPDYENSIKESISAVEAMCCIITGMNGAQATLGKAIRKLKDSGVHIHSAMEEAFSKLYGYASDENGIRHGGIDFQSAPAEDAKFMLISCSAFVNYLIEKWSKVNPS